MLVEDHHSDPAACASDQVASNAKRILNELGELIAIPSVSTLSTHREDVRRCANWLADHMRGVGLTKAEVRETRGHPIVYAEWLNAPGAPTLLVYGHYDVQPIEPLGAWKSPPFAATVRDGCLFARGATDDKGQLFIHLKAIEALLKTQGRLPLNIKLLLEGEEETGSTHLPQYLSEHKEELGADLAVISDTAFFAKGIPSLCYGLRGIACFELEVTGPNRDLHSGSFGGAIHNPIQALAQILAGLHDQNGRMTIEGFYDDVRELADSERKFYKRLPWDDEEFRCDLGVPALYGETDFTTLERLWARPTLECNGIWGGFSGEGVKTVLPSSAGAKISMRLVPDQQPERIAQVFERHLRSVTPPTVTVSCRHVHGAEPILLPTEGAGIRAAISALRRGFGVAPVLQRDGGSIPVVLQFKKLFGLDTVLLGFGLPNENAHAPNEFLSLENFFKGIRTAAYFYDDFAAIRSEANLSVGKASPGVSQREAL